MIKVLSSTFSHCKRTVDDLSKALESIYIRKGYYYYPYSGKLKNKTRKKNKKTNYKRKKSKK